MLRVDVKKSMLIIVLSVFIVMAGCRGTVDEVNEEEGHIIVNSSEESLDDVIESDENVDEEVVTEVGTDEIDGDEDSESQVEPIFEGTYEKYNLVANEMKKYDEGELVYLGDGSAYAIFYKYYERDREVRLFMINKDYPENDLVKEFTIPGSGNLLSIRFDYILELGGKSIIVETDQGYYTFDEYSGSEYTFTKEEFDQLSVIDSKEGTYEFISESGLVYESEKGNKVTLGYEEKNLELIPICTFRDSDNKLLSVIEYRYLDETQNTKVNHILWRMSQDNVAFEDEKEELSMALVDVAELSIDADLQQCLYWTEKGDNIYVVMLGRDRDTIGIGQMKKGTSDDIMWTKIEFDNEVEIWSYQTIDSTDENQLSFVLRFRDDVSKAYTYNYANNIIEENSLWEQEINSNSVFEDQLDSISEYMVFSDNKYAYITDDYRVMLFSNGELKEVFKGYYEDSVGGVGIYVSIPGGLEFSKTGDYVSFFVSGYEWNDGPFIYDMEGDLIYVPDNTESDYVGGQWLENNRFMIETYWSDLPVWIVDLDELTETKYGFTDTNSVFTDSNGRIIVQFRDDLKEPLTHYFVETKANSGEFYDLYLKKMKGTSGGGSLEQYVIVDEDYVYQYDAYNSDMTVNTYSFSHLNTVSAFCERTNISPKNNMICLGKNIYVHKNGEYIEYYFFTDYSGYILLDKRLISEAKIRIPGYQWWHSDEIRNFDNKVIFDVETGNIVEYEALDRYMDGQVFEIVSGDFSGDVVYYMVTYDIEDETHVEVMLKYLWEDEFESVDHYILPDHVKDATLTLLAEGEKTLMYDYYDYEYGRFDIMRSVSGEKQVKYENAMNIRLDDMSGAMFYIDLNTGDYITNDYKVSRSELPLLGSYEGYGIRSFNDNGDMEISVKKSLYPANSNMLVDYEGGLNVGDGIIVGVENMYLLYRVTVLVEDENGDLEKKVLEMNLETVEDYYNIEAYYDIDEAFVNGYYQYRENIIDYDAIELNYDAYPTLPASLGIQGVNIDLEQVPDIRPILDEYLQTLIELDVGFNQYGNITNYDYSIYLGQMLMSEEKQENARRYHSELQDVDLSTWTNDEYNQFVREKVEKGGFYNADEKEILAKMDITYYDAPVLIKEFGEIESWSSSDQDEMVKILEKEYEDKIKKCKQYLAQYGIYKIHGRRFD